jgi:Transposase DDE domain
MVNIDRTLGIIKTQAHQLLDARRIVQLCREFGYWPEADGKLDPATLVALFMQQIVAGNVSCDQVRLMGQDAFSASGYCQARMRLPLAVIQTLAREVYQKISTRIDREPEHRWHGHRVLLLDATSFSMPDTPELQAHFGQSGQQKAGCGFPTAHLLMLFNARTGLAVDALTAPLRTHEMSLAARTHQQMSPGDLVIGDDSFGSYAHLALLQQRGMHGLFPAHHVRIVDFTPRRACIEPSQVARAKEARGLPRSRWVMSLGRDDQIVQWFKPQNRPQWMSAADWKALPPTLTVREVRRKIARPGFRPVTLTIVTTLLDPRLYPAEELFALRLRRWDVETDLRHLKTTMKMDILHCKSVDGVQKELWMFLLVYNLVRAVMLAAAQRQEVAVSRISFASALGWMRCAQAGDRLPRLAIVPLRPNRLEPRAVKRRPKPYAQLARPRAVMRQEARLAWAA